MLEERKKNENKITCKYHRICPRSNNIDPTFCQIPFIEDCQQFHGYELEALENKERCGEMFEAAYHQFEHKHRITKSSKEIMNDALNTVDGDTIFDYSMSLQQFFTFLREEEEDIEHWFLVECAAQKNRSWRERKEILRQILENKHKFPGVLK